MEHLRCAMLVMAAMAAFSSSVHARPFIDPRAERSDAIDQAAASEPRDPACHDRTLAAAGGALPRNPHTLAVRWTGYGNFELVTTATSCCSMTLDVRSAAGSDGKADIREGPRCATKSDIGCELLHIPIDQSVLEFRLV
jgi:hypothetical protein